MYATPELFVLLSSTTLSLSLVHLGSRPRVPLHSFEAFCKERTHPPTPTERRDVLSATNERRSLSLSLSLCVFVFFYIYIYMFKYIFISAVCQKEGRKEGEGGGVCTPVFWDEMNSLRLVYYKSVTEVTDVEGDTRWTERERELINFSKSNNDGDREIERES